MVNYDLDCMWQAYCRGDIEWGEYYDALMQTTEDLTRHHPQVDDANYTIKAFNASDHQAEHHYCQQVFNTPADWGQDVIQASWQGGQYRTLAQPTLVSTVSMSLAQLAPWSNFGAWDSKGRFWVFEQKPALSDDGCGWIAEGGAEHLLVDLNIEVATWRHSLIDFRKG